MGRFLLSGHALSDHASLFKLLSFSQTQFILCIIHCINITLSKAFDLKRKKTRANKFIF